MLHILKSLLTCRVHSNILTSSSLLSKCLSAATLYMKLTLVIRFTPWLLTTLPLTPCKCMFVTLYLGSRRPSVCLSPPPSPPSCATPPRTRPVDRTKVRLSTYLRGQERIAFFDLAQLTTRCVLSQMQYELPLAPPSAVDHPPHLPQPHIWLMVLARDKGIIHSSTCLDAHQPTEVQDLQQWAWDSHPIPPASPSPP